MWRLSRSLLQSSRFLLLTKPCSATGAKNLSVKSFREMPGPSVLENIIKYTGRSMDNFHLDMVEGFEKYGPVYKFHLPGFKMVCASDPKDIEHVFRNDDIPAMRGIDSSFGRYFTYKGMKEGISGDDESWYKHRSTTAPNMLQAHQNKGYIPGLTEIADASITSLKEGRITDLLPFLQLWATECIYYVMFGHRAGTNVGTPSEKDLEFVKAVYDAFDSESKLAVGFPLQKYIKTPELKRFFTATDVIANFTFEFMEKIKNSPSTLPSGYECLFEKFKRENELSDDEIIQVAVTLLAGGVDTASNKLISCLFMLSKFQRAQDKLYEEINEILPNGQTPTYDDLSKMTYLRATISEVARLSPVTVGTARKLSKPIVLSGYEVPAGVILTLSGYKSQQMRRELFGDPEEFRPERWLRENKNFHAFAALPFGFGPRMCLGRRIAVMEISLFLIRLLQKFKVEKNNRPEDQLAWKFGVVQTPDRPFNMHLSAR